MSLLSEDELEVTHRVIEKRVLAYEKAGRLGRMVFAISFACGVLSLPLGEKLGIPMAPPPSSSIPTIGGSVSMAIMVGGLLAAARIWNTAGRKHGVPSPEDRLFLRVYDILKDIKYYSKHQDEKEVYLRASHSMREIVERMEQYPESWSLGRLRLVANTLGEPLRIFRQGLEQHLLPFLEGGETTKLAVALEALEWLASYLANPHLGILSSFNQVAFALPRVERIRAPTFLGRLSRYFGPVDWIAIAAIVVLVLFVTYLGGTWGVEKGYLYTGGIALFGILSGIYFSRLRPRGAVYMPSESKPVTITVRQSSGDARQDTLQ